MRYCLAILFVCAAARPAIAGPSQTALIGVRHERGVETKLAGSMLAQFDAGTRASLFAGVVFSALEHYGLSGLELGAACRVFNPWDISLSGALQHEQWNDWQVGENRALLLVSSRLLRRVRLGLGTALRLPVSAPAQYWLPFYWHSDAPELNLLYEAEWRFFESDRLSASARLANVDRLRVRDPQTFPFRLSGSFRVAPGWTLEARCGASINGFSSMLISLGETTADVGVKHEF